MRTQYLRLLRLSCRVQCQPSLQAPRPCSDLKHMTQREVSLLADCF